MLIIEDLQVKIGNKKVLKHVDLEIQSGKHISCLVRTGPGRRPF